MSEPPSILLATDIFERLQYHELLHIPWKTLQQFMFLSQRIWLQICRTNENSTLPNSLDPNIAQFLAGALDLNLDVIYRSWDAFHAIIPSITPEDLTTITLDNMFRLHGMHHKVGRYPLAGIQSQSK